MVMLSDLEFSRISRFFEKLKILHGPEYVNATLKRHKDIFIALQDYEKRYIVDLESNLISRSDKHE